MTEQPQRPGGDGLLPCPFCHCTDVRMEDYFSTGEWRARCERCGCQTCWWHSEQQAREAWNTRAAPPQPAPDALREVLLKRAAAYRQHGGKLFSGFDVANDFEACARPPVSTPTARSPKVNEGVGS
jgi:hypothetical protein